MGLRFESNFQYLGGIAPFIPDDSDVLTRWFRVHEWQVDDGFTSTLLMVLLNVEPPTAPPTTVDYGWMRVLTMLSTTKKIWTTCFEAKMIGAVTSCKQFCPRLVILPCGSGITFSAGQGLMTKALSSVATTYRWWSCYVLKADAA